MRTSRAATSRLSAPQRQGWTERGARRLRAPGQARRPAAGDQAVEHVQIQLAGRDVDAVAGTAHPHALAEPGAGQRTAQHRDGGLHLRARRRRRADAPDAVDQRLQRDDLIGAQQQQREHHLLPARGHRDRLVAAHLQRAEDAERRLGACGRAGIRGAAESVRRLRGAGAVPGDQVQVRPLSQGLHSGSPP
jgi:hypothetical protein